MKIYCFSGYFLNGKGNLYNLSDWSFSDDDFYYPHSKDLRKIGYVDCDFAPSRADMSRISVHATGLREALSHLRFFLLLNDLSVVLSARYECLSNGRKSSRLLRLLLDDV